MCSDVTGLVGSQYAYVGESCRLITPQDELGNRIPDFSTAGYRNGNEPLPDVGELINPFRTVRVSPIEGDNTEHVQAAIDQVEALPLDENGFRGIVHFNAGEFPIEGGLTVLASGVILRGAGQGDDPTVDTILRATGTSDRSLLTIGAANSLREIGSTRHNIVDKYVPVGATSVTVDATTGWSVGDEVTVFRPSTAEWISELGTDQIPPRSDGGEVVQWEPGFRFDQSYERVITRIEGNRVFLDAPLTHGLDQQFGGGVIFRSAFTRINQVGIENIRGKSDFTSPIDEDHASTFIELRAVEDSWVTDVTGQHFVFATVLAATQSKRITVDGAASLEPVSQITGGRRYPFVIDGQFILMRNLYSENGRHDFVNNSASRGNRGPNVFLDGVAVNSQSSTGPHQRYSVGTLYDTIHVTNEIEARNRGNFGTGHGWAGANHVFWNPVASGYLVQSPPTAQNWLIGATGGGQINDTRFGQQPPAEVDSFGTPIDFEDSNNVTNSLYIAQLNQRLSLFSELPVLEQRQYLLGDYDGGEHDGAESLDNVFVDPLWLAELDTMASLSTVVASDIATPNQTVPFSFDYRLDEDEVVYSATLTLGLRGTSGDSSDDVLFFDSLSDTRSLRSLGIEVLAEGETTPVTIEVFGEDLAALQDGLLNLAVSEDTAIDFVSLEIGVGLDQQQQMLVGDINGDSLVGFQDFLILSANFGTTSDATSADGDLDDNGAVNFADFLILSQNFGRSST